MKITIDIVILLLLVGLVVSPCQGLGAEVVGELPGTLMVDNAGVASYSIPMDVPGGTGGMEPNLSITYSSSGGNGLLGMGFAVGGLSGITRAPAIRHLDTFFDAVDFDDNDRLMLDGKRLILVSTDKVYGENGSEYRTEIDSFSRIILHGAMNDPDSWFSVETKSGLTHVYGQSLGTPASNAGVKLSGRPGNENISWLVSKTGDSLGNYMTYYYIPNYGGVEGEHLLDRIEYTLNDNEALSAYCEVRFVYESGRPDSVSGYKMGSEFNQTKLLDRVEMYYEQDKVWQYSLEYQTSPNNVSLLQSVEKTIGSDVLPKTVFDWNSMVADHGWSGSKPDYAPPFPLARTAIKELDGNKDPLYIYNGGGEVVDLNGDGLLDLYYNEWLIPGFYYEDSQWGGEPVWADGYYANGVYSSSDPSGYGQTILNGAVMNTGSGFDFSSDFYGISWLCYAMYYRPLGRQDLGYRWVDLNSDGLMDMAIGRVHNQPFRDGDPTLNQVAMWLNTGTSWADGRNLYRPDVGDFCFSSTETEQGWRLVDLNADGLDDALYATHHDGYFESHALLNSPDGWESQWSPEYETIYPLRYSTGGALDETIDPGAQLIDINGDGLVDLVYGDGHYDYHITILNTGDGWATDGNGDIVGEDAYLLPYMITDSDGRDAGTRFVDVNGDGLIDVVNNQNPVYLNTGIGWVEDSAQTYTLPRNVIDGTIGRLRILDVNNDGLNDLVYILSTSKGHLYSPPQIVYLSTGSGWAAPADQSAYQLPYSFAMIHDGQGVSLEPCFGDLDGDGLTDFFYNHEWALDEDPYWSGPHWQNKGIHKGAVLNNGVYGNLVTKITEGYRDVGIHSSVTEIEYSPLTDPEVYLKGTEASYPYRDFQGAAYVVSKQTNDDGVGGVLETLYTYSEAISHQERGFLGFRTFESYDVQKKLSKIDWLKQEYPHAGSVESSITYYDPDPDDPSQKKKLKEIQNYYYYDNVVGGTIFPYIAKSEEYTWDITSSGQHVAISSSTTYNWFDQQDTSVVQSGEKNGAISLGNLTQVKTVYDDASELITENYYEGTLDNDYAAPTSSDNWFIGRLTSSAVSHVPSVITVDNPVITKTASFEYYSNTGLLWKETSDPTTALWIETEHVYDGFGNITDKYISLDGVTRRLMQHTDYDSKGRLVDAVFNALDHPETYEEYDQVRGLVKTQRGPNNQPTFWEYDAQGRPTLETHADGTTTQTHYEWGNQAMLTFVDPLDAGSSFDVEVWYTVRSESTATPSVIVYHDKMGREIRTLTTGPDGRIIQKDTVYNNLGLTLATSESYFSTDTPIYTVMQYDFLNRSETATVPDGTVTEYVYEGLVNKIIVDSDIRSGTGDDAAKNQTTTTTRNSKGQVVNVTDAHAKTVSYIYYADGALWKTIAPGNIVTTMKYDIRGNKTEQNDQDMGVWTYVYNALDQLVSQTDNKFQTTSMLYDELGRMVRREAPDGVARWYYDGTDDGGKIGALQREELYADVQETDLTYRKVYAYDSLGRPLFDLMNYDNKWYYNYLIYDEYSRIKETHRCWRPHDHDGDQMDPVWNSFGTINHYDSMSTLMSVSDTQGHTWWTREAADYDARGHLLEFQLGNDVVTKHIYDPLTGRLENIQSRQGNSTYANVQDYLCTFDRIGNLKLRQNGLKPFIGAETFTYDDLNRLKKTYLDGTEKESVTYDDAGLGNIASKTGVGDYTYAERGAGPHAVTTAGGVSYIYDGNGNMVHRGTVGGPYTLNVQWTSFNKPLRIDQHDPDDLLGTANYSEFTYDIDNNRITQLIGKGDSLTKKIYIGGMEQEERAVDPDVAQIVWNHQETRIFISTPSGTVGVHVQNAADEVTRKYYHYDHLGTVTEVTGEKLVGMTEADLLAEYSYDSWGKRRDAETWIAAVVDTDNLQTDRGFTGHEMLDNIGLIHMNGRIYDSVLGRFLSADTILQEPYNLQSHNRYSYVINNPLSIVDASGHIFTFLAWLATLAIQASTYVAGAIVAGVTAATGLLWGAFGVAQSLAGAYGGLAGFLYGAYSGGKGAGCWEGVVNGAFMSALSAGVAMGVGNAFGHGGWFSTFIESARALSHGVSQGLLSSFQGGSFKEGFLSGCFSSAVGSVMHLEGMSGISGSRGLSTIVSAVAGGTASELGGGKFINGAVTGTFINQYNHSPQNTVSNVKTDDIRTFEEKYEVWTGGLSVEDTVLIYNKYNPDDILTVDDIKGMFASPKEAERFMTERYSRHGYGPTHLRGIMNQNSPKMMTKDTMPAGWRKLNFLQSWFHNPWHSPFKNQKFVGPGGHMEGVYYKGHKVTDPKYVATFNIFGPSNTGGHTAADVNTWTYWKKQGKLN